MKKLSFYHYVVFLLPALMFLASCGGSGGGSAASPAPTTAISGSVFASSVAGASVTVKTANGSTVAGPVNTANDGTYTINVPTSALAGDLRFESSSGAFADEATGATTTAVTLAAYVTGGTLTTGPVHLDPSSTVIHGLVTQQSRTFGEAAAIFNTAFGYAPDISIAPKNAPSSGSDDAQRLKGFRAGVFSQLTKDMSLTPDKQFALLGAITQDLADDGKLNGSAGLVDGAPLSEDMQNRFERALVSYLSDTTHNLTGLAADKIGGLPFGKVALTSTYRVEYLPGMMSATQGKTTFKIKITNRSDGSAATGLTVSLKPLMHMAAMSHATPVDTVTEEGSTGIYDGTAYYLMASGSGMGYWELKVMIGAETATFYPSVGMAMGTTTVRATLKGQNDIINGMTGTEKRSYYLFNDGPAGTTGFKVFIAAKESMMSYPAVSTGTTLHDATNTLWTVNPITVSASTDGSTWVPASDNAGGHWSVSGLSGLSSGVTGTIYVKVNIDGEDKTTDGNAPSGSNAYATFTVTPQ